MTDNGTGGDQGEGRPGILSDPGSTHSGREEPDASAPTGDTEPDTDEAFALIGNDIRIEILRALGVHDRRTGTDDPLSFSALRSRADLEVGSAQFNYHLQQLVGTYVQKSEAGYRLRPEGKTLYRTIRAGTFTSRRSLARQTVDQPCYYCEGELELAYDDGMFSIQCYTCETLYDLILAPPAAIQSDEDILDRVTTYNYHLRHAVAHGVCPTCVTALETALLPPTETGFTDVVERSVYIYRSCAYCGNHSYLSVGSAFLHHPAVIGFCYERGLDVTDTPRWEFEFAATDRTVSVRSTDPWEVALEIPTSDATLELVVDGDLAIRERAVSGGSAPGDSHASES